MFDRGHLMQIWVFSSLIREKQIFTISAIMNFVYIFLDCCYYFLKLLGIGAHRNVLI